MQILKVLATLPFLLPVLFPLIEWYQLIEWYHLLSASVAFMGLTLLAVKGAFYKYRSHAVSLGADVIDVLKDISSERKLKSEKIVSSMSTPSRGFFGFIQRVSNTIEEAKSEFNEIAADVNESAAKEIQEQVDFLQSYNPLPVRRCVYIMGVPFLYTAVAFFTYLFDLSVVYPMVINLLIGCFIMWYICIHVKQTIENLTKVLTWLYMYERGANSIFVFNSVKKNSAKVINAINGSSDFASLVKLLELGEKL